MIARVQRGLEKAILHREALPRTTQGKCRLQGLTSAKALRNKRKIYSPDKLGSVLISTCTLYLVRISYTEAQ